MVLATNQVTQARSLWQKHAATAIQSLTDGNKGWTVNEFAGNYVYDIAGVLHLIATEQQSTVLTLTAGVRHPRRVRIRF